MICGRPALCVTVGLLVAGCGSENNLLPFTTQVGQDPPRVPAPESVGSWLSFDRSPEGQRITMSFYDRDASALAYAVGGVEDDGTVTWAYERVDGYESGDPDVGKYTSQKTAPDGSVWVAYQDVDAGALKVAHRTNPNAWDVQTADAGPGVGNWISLALDAQGRPVISHCDDAGSVRLTRHDGSQFATSTVYTGSTGPGGAAAVGYTAISIVVDREFVAFQDVAAGELHLLRGVAGSFNDEVVDSGGVGAWPSILASGADLRLAYHDVANQHLKYAAQSGTAPWVIETVDGAPLRGADTAIFDDGGEPAIAYFDGMNNDVWVATHAAGDWSTAKVAGDGGAAGYHNEVVSVGGRTFVGSYDFTSDGLVLKVL